MRSAAFLGRAALLAVALLPGCGPAEPVSIALNVAFVAASPVGQALLGDCAEFAPPRITESWCRLRRQVLADEAERTAMIRAQQPQRHDCRRSLAGIDCISIGDR